MIFPETFRQHKDERFKKENAADTIENCSARKVPTDSPNTSDTTEIDEIAKTFVIVNERPVDDISLNFFYKSHTITLLTVAILAVIYFAFVRNEDILEDNIGAGLLCMVFFFLIVSILAFPNGPFTRPHPVVWRILFGCSVLYLLTLQFLIFQNHATVRGIFYWFDPKLKEFHITMEKEYGVNCSNVSVDRIKSHLDIFALGHFLGWAFKALLIRDTGILWAMSINWEITEIAFAHLLPNFIECWWDAILLDVIICNGAGIHCGIYLCKLLEIREYKWVSIKDISTTTGRIKRAMLQFTPESWSAIRWLDPKCTFMRFVAFGEMVIFWQLTELNTFFLKHIFEIPPDHILVIGRLIFIGIVVAPTVRQYYSYITDTRCKRLGTQCWVFAAIQVTEAILCIKNGRQLFGQTDGANVAYWLILQAIFSVLTVLVCVAWHRYKDKSKIE